MPFIQTPEVLLERYIVQVGEWAQAASIPEIKAVMIDAHDKLCALWRCERTRRLELIRMAREEVSRQRAVLGALELAGLDAIREIV